MSAMNRREFVSAGLALGIVPSAAEIISPFIATENAKETVFDAESAPEWLKNGPIVMAGCWDDFPLFQKRKGGGPVPSWLDRVYKEQGQPETIRAMKEAGVTLAVIHFFKGFGLSAEREHIEDARSLAGLLKDNDIRVGLYVGSTIAYETFLLEEPGAEAWFVPDFMGKPLYYSDQTFRRRVYFMHPGYRAYIRRVLQYGIEQLHPDLIHFDNTSQQARPGIFQHPLAIQDFRKYLGSKYSASKLKGRLGFSDVRYVLPPKIEDVPPRIDDPLFQEFAEFRCHQLTSYYAEMQSFIRSLDKSVATDNNPAAGISGRNLIWEQGVDYPQLMNEVDAVWTEEGDAATVTPEGVLVSKIRTLKAASMMNKPVFCYTWGAFGNWGYEENGGGLLQMAESMAYNRQCLGMVGIVNAIPDLPPEPRRYIRFFHDNFHLYRGAEPISDVALLYSFPSMGFNEDRPAVSFMLAGQTFIQARTLFDIIFDQHLERLSKYRTLFLADQECLSDRQIGLIRQFVMNGGGLVATEHTSLYNEHRKRRQNFGLKDCFGVSAPSWLGSSSPEALLSGGPTRTQVGKGQVVYVPEIMPAIAKRANQADRRSQHFWSLPVNNKELYDAVSVSLQGVRTVNIPDSVSPYVTIELVNQPADNRLVLHVLNYDHAKTPQQKDIPVTIAVPGGRNVRQIQTLSPDQHGKVELLHWTEKNGISFTIPFLQIYTVVTLDLI